jgi:hypothetical protein
MVATLRVAPANPKTETSTGLAGALFCPLAGVYPPNAWAPKGIYRVDGSVDSRIELILAPTASVGSFGTNGNIPTALKKFIRASIPPTLIDEAG